MLALGAKSVFGGMGLTIALAWICCVVGDVADAPLQHVTGWDTPISGRSVAWQESWGLTKTLASPIPLDLQSNAKAPPALPEVPLLAKEPRLGVQHGTVFAAGWPFRSLPCALPGRLVTDRVRSAQSTRRVLWGVLIKDDPTSPMLLPLCPMWPGLLANVIAFAGMVCLALIGKGRFVVSTTTWHVRRLRLSCT